ncbi:putative GTPase activating protein for Arf-domain-containing protein [Achaetomium macrosporum]|uniref:GTPase activating protein for Arf-domain-containing protein n=1 Tax=Achaetomium macrosporum TaxID=79813 RepID=A0AAN7HF96_9PEZI|nr:putative GTPase activating protein for Arf-domain-containing protein [Achaetomium macrosporum]
MSSALSKRQQARNEKALQDLLHSVPGNNFCADCQAQNPAWASWSLGIFLCMRCATIHRKLGTHISKVKSLSMDSWTNEQVDNMRKVGNVVSNKLYNPENKKPPVPIDADEADSAMERFIRQKYISRTLSTNKRPGGNDSDDTPPPLPPKTPSRFGLRSASSIFPLGSKSKKTQEPASPRESQPHPPLRNKSSGVFGVSVERDRRDGDDTERKLAQLRDMGFRDDHKNSMVLKGVGGSLEKAVETLIRLGEGGGKPAPLLGPARASTMPVTRSLTPSAGSDAPRTRPISPASTNPFDMLDAPPTPQPLSTQSTGTLQTRNPYASTNPFGAPQQAPSALDLAFQNMSLAPPSQPLFPHHTGGLAQQQNPQSVYQQTMTGPLTAPLPPVAPGYSAMGVNGIQTYQQGIPTQQPAMGSYNPFFVSQQPTQPPLSVNTAQFGGNLSSNPFTRSPTRMQSPTLSQIPEQTQQQFYAAPVQQQPQTTNPFLTQMTSVPPQQQLGQMQMHPQLGLTPQMTGYMQQYQQQQPPRPDKASILALYNYPQPAPNQNTNQTANQFQSQDAGQTATSSSTTTATPQGPAQTPNSLFPQHPQPQPQQQQQQQQPAPVSPGPGPGPGVGGSKNPFAAANAGAGTGAGRLAEPAPKHNASRDSMMALGLEWSNGRHSPDAFASLSARDTR